jgi:hypothetical protein
MDLGYFKPNNKNKTFSRYQTTGEIASAIVKAIKESKNSAERLAPYFKAKNKLESARLIFIFCKQVLPYVKESGERQTAKTMNRILSDAKKYGGDCKHFSTLSSALCLALNIPCKLRLISQNYGSKQPNHIYCVAIINGKEVILDSVLKNFDTEARYNYKYDINLN